MDAQAERRARGAERWTRITTKPPVEVTTPYDEAMIDFVWAEVWTRPGLTLKERRWISMTMACADAVPNAIRSHIRSSLTTGDITLDEMLEFVVQFAAYAGWPRASLLQSLVIEVAQELGQWEGRGGAR